MTHDYREKRKALVERYEWPKPEDPRFHALEAQGWDEVCLILEQYVERWMQAANIYATTSVDEILTAQAGPVWYAEECVEKVVEFLDSL